MACERIDGLLNAVIQHEVKSHLPPPKQSASMLEKVALKNLSAWNLKYGKQYPKIALACRYLSSLPFVRFPPNDSSAETIRHDTDTALGEDGNDASLERAILGWPTQKQSCESLLHELRQSLSLFRDSARNRCPQLFTTDESDNEWEDVEGTDIPCESACNANDVQAAKMNISEIQTVVETCSRCPHNAAARRVLREAIDVTAQLQVILCELERKFGDVSHDSSQETRHGSREPSRGAHVAEMAAQQESEVVVGTQRIRDPTERLRRRMKNERKSEDNFKQPRKRATGAKDDQVLKKLAKIAPVLPLGPYTRVWDSNAPPVYAGSHAMEVTNHWGPVDVHQELPKQRMDEFFLVDQSQIQSKTHRSGQGPTSSKPSRAKRVSAPEIQQLDASCTILNHSKDKSEVRQAERAYNDSLLRDASEEQSPYLHALDNLPSSIPVQSRKKNHKFSVVERLSKKLFNPRARATVFLEKSQIETDSGLDLNSNKWQNV